MATIVRGLKPFPYPPPRKIKFYMLLGQHAKSTANQVSLLTPQAPAATAAIPEASKPYRQLKPAPTQEEREQVRRTLRDHAINILEWSAEDFYDVAKTITKQTRDGNNPGEDITQDWLYWEALRRTWGHFCK